MRNVKVGLADLLKEQHIPIVEVCRRRNVSPETIWRWRKKGVRGVKLESFTVGGRVYTTVEALERFIAGCTVAREADADDRVESGQRSESTSRRLASAGLL